MYKSFLVAGCFLLGACEMQQDVNNTPVVNQVDAVSNASAFQTEAAKLLNQYLQMKALVSSDSDSIRLHQLAKTMMQSADSLTTLSNHLPEPIRDSVAGASMALSDELSAVSIENDLHELQMAFQVSSLQLFELLKWIKLPGVTIYKYFDVEGIAAKGATWLDITRMSEQPYDRNANRKNYLIIDSLIQ